MTTTAMDGTGLRRQTPAAAKCDRYGWGRRATTWWLGCLLAAALGLTLGHVPSQAHGGTGTTAGAERTADSGDRTLGRCILADRFSPCPSPRTKAAQFRQGRLGRTRGVPVRRIFHRPAIAREQIVSKIVRRLRAVPPARRATLYTDASRFPRCSSGGGGQTSRACAYELYAEWREEANCVHQGYVYVRPNSRQCVPATGNTRKFTKREVQAFGGLLLCGAGVAVTVSTAGSGAVLGAIVGGTACGWNLWTALD